MKSFVENINWRLGFWRLWLFISLLWAILFGAISFPDMLQEKSTHFYYSAIRDTLNLSYYSLPEERYFDNGEFVAIDFPGDVRISFVAIVKDKSKQVLLPSTGAGNGEWVQVASPQPLEKAKGTLNEIGKRAVDQRWNGRIKEIAIIVVVGMIGPPLALLFLGLAVGWIIGGFRKSSPPTF